MSFSHLSQAREANATFKEVDIHDPRTLGPGSYGKLHLWEGKPECKTRPKTSFGSSVNEEHPRFSHIERDSSMLQHKSLMDEHRLLLKRNQVAARSPKKRGAKQPVDSSTSHFHPDKMEPYTMKLPTPLGEKLRQKRQDGSASPPRKHDI